MTLTLPAAVYGKGVVHDGGLPGQFRWQQRDAAFPDIALKTADHWCRRFQWTVAQEQLHEPVALWLPQGPQGREGALMLHFSDIGRDDRGRMGTLRMEAAYAAPGWQDQSPNLPAIFLAQAIANDSILDDDTSTSITLDEGALDAEDALRVARVAVRARPSGVLASRTYKGFSLTGSDSLLLLDPETWEPIKEVPRTSAAPSKTMMVQPAASRTSSASWSRKKKKHIPWGTLTTTVLVVLVVGLLAYFAWAMKENMKSSDAELLEKSNTINRLKEENADLVEQLLSAQKLALSAESELARVTNTLKEKNEQISRMNEDINGAVQDQLRRLQELDSAIETVRPFLERLMALAVEAQGAELREALSRITESIGKEVNN